MSEYAIGAIRLLYLTIFGLVGVYCRYFINSFVLYVLQFNILTGTFFVNVLGSIMIAIVQGAYNQGYISQDLKVGLTAGLLGGLTTFSGYAIDTNNLFRNNDYVYAIIYVVITPIVAVGACIAVSYGVDPP